VVEWRNSVGEVTAAVGVEASAVVSVLDEAEEEEVIEVGEVAEV
jgi:hypothetical protein